MAVNRTAAAGNNSAGAAPTQTPRSNGGVPRGNANALLAAAMTATNGRTTLSPDGNDFVKHLRESLSVSDSGMEIRPIPNATGGAHLVSLGNFGIILAFTEMITTQNQQTPKSRIIQNIVATYQAWLQATGQTFSLLNVILVDTVDYRRYEQYAAHVTAVLRTQAVPDLADLNLAALVDGATVYSVNSNLADVLAFIELHSPHAVPRRASYGMLFGIRQNVSQENRQGFDIDEQSSVMAITGYTDFTLARDQTGKRFFMPVVIISDIVATVPNLGLASMGISMFNEKYSVHRGWRIPYQSLSPNEPNLGSLMLDSTGAPFKAMNTDELDQFGRDNITTASQLAIEVYDGRANIPGVGALANPRLHAAVLQQLSKFYSADMGTISVGNISREHVAGTLGERQQGSRLRDSAYMTYLDMVGVYGNSSNINDLQLLLTNDPNNFRRRVTLISQFDPSFTALYMSTELWFDVNLLNALAALTKNSGITIVRNDQQEQYVDSAYLHTLGAGQQSTVSVMTYAAPNNNNQWGVGNNGRDGYAF